MHTRLKQAILLLDEVRDNWMNDSAAAAPNEQGYMLPAVNAEIERAVALVEGECQDEDYPLEDRGMVLAAEVFLDEWTRWRRAIEADIPGTPQEGTERMWMALDAAVQATRPFISVPLEPLVELIDGLGGAGGVSIRQAAKMYEYFTADGRPDETLTQRIYLYLKKNNNEVGDDFPYAEHYPKESTHDREYRESVEEDWEKRKARKREIEALTPTPDKPAEPIEMHIEAGVSLKQLQKMYPEVTREEIVTKAVELNVKLPVDYSETLHTRPKSMHEQAVETNDAINDAAWQKLVDEVIPKSPHEGDNPLLDTLSQRILTMAEDEGMSATTICKILTNEGYEDLTPAKVGKMRYAAKRLVEQVEEQSESVATGTS